ncbi:hypothetical protein C8J56DRAFT_910791 [Mycena floridula]|nr:hypothetical protein C8J56DRAFT_910791 [Mycena floridula]
MGTKKGILALAEFIEKSGAFTKTGKPRKDQDMPTLEEEPDPVERDEPCTSQQPQSTISMTDTPASTSFHRRR